MPRGCRKSKQTSWGEGQSLPWGEVGLEWGTVLRGTEKARQGPRPRREAWDVPHLGARLGIGEHPLVPQGWPQAGEGPEATPQGYSPLTFYRIKGMLGWGEKHQVR